LWTQGDAPLTIDMRDDHVRRRSARSRAASGSRAAGADPEGDRAPRVDPDPDAEAASQGDRLMRWLLVAAIACIAGCVLVLAISGPKIATAAGIVLGGTAVVLLISAVFYAIGRSEDRERASREGPEDPRS
jgi:hypothetical protein